MIYNLLCTVWSAESLCMFDSHQAECFCCLWVCEQLKMLKCVCWFCSCKCHAYGSFINAGALTLIAVIDSTECACTLRIIPGRFASAEGLHASREQEYFRIISLHVARGTWMWVCTFLKFHARCAFCYWRLKGLGPKSYANWKYGWFITAHTCPSDLNPRLTSHRF